VGWLVGALAAVAFRGSARGQVRVLMGRVSVRLTHPQERVAMLDWSYGRGQGVQSPVSSNTCCQGRREGRCSVHRRAERVSRPGMVSSRRRNVFAFASRDVSGVPSSCVQRMRLCARVWRAARRRWR
jgi:hypothetical protein